MKESSNEKLSEEKVKQNDNNKKNTNGEETVEEINSNVNGSINNTKSSPLGEISECSTEDEKDFSYLTKNKNIGSFFNRKYHKPLPDRLALSFSGAGFLGIYHYGVIHCLQGYAPTLMSKVVRYAGTSAGSIIASLFALSPELFNQSIKLIMELADESNSRAFGPITNGFSIHEKLVKAVGEVIPSDISCLKDKLYISMTNAQTNENILYNNFTTKEQLTAAICASCYIPGWSANISSPHPVVDGISYIDGGISNNLPVFDDIETVTISPFSGNADISPVDNSLLSSLLPMQITFGKQVYSASLANFQRMGYALFPPKGETLKMYYDLGFKDAFLYLYESGRLERPKGTIL
uniref:PNPLA domain-containing protein n=1 Tax=Strongyloides venezuelensis TaxID=75913 RepID=A0A0K0FAD1_STRVS